MENVDIQKALEEIKSLECKKNELVKTIQAYNENVGKLLGQKSSVEKDIEKIKKDFSAINEDLIAAKKELRDVKTTIDAELALARNSLAGREESLEKRIQEFEAEKDKFSRMHERIAELKQDVDAKLRRQSQDTAAAAEKLQELKHIDKKMQALVEKEAEVLSAETRLSERLGKLALEEKRIDEYRAIVEKEKSKLESKEKELAIFKQEAVDIIEKYKNEISIYNEFSKQLSNKDADLLIREQKVKEREALVETIAQGQKLKELELEQLSARIREEIRKRNLQGVK